MDVQGVLKRDELKYVQLNTARAEHRAKGLDCKKKGNGWTANGKIKDRKRTDRRLFEKVLKGREVTIPCSYRASLQWLLL